MKDGLYIPDAFKEYLTEAAIKDYVENLDKGSMCGGSNGNINWGRCPTETVSTSTGAVTNTRVVTGTGAVTGTGTVAMTNTGAVTGTGSSGGGSGGSSGGSGSGYTTSVARGLNSDVASRVDGISHNIIQKGLDLKATEQIKYLNLVISGIENLGKKPEYAANAEIQAIIKSIVDSLKARNATLSVDPEAFGTQIQSIVDESYRNR